MSRAIDGSKRKEHRKKILKQAKGYWGRRGTNYKTAKDAVAKSLTYAYRDRKDRKGNFRRLWIIRINAACREQGISYSRLIAGLDKAGVSSIAKPWPGLRPKTMPLSRRLSKKPRPL